MHFDDEKQLDNSELVLGIYKQMKCVELTWYESGWLEIARKLEKEGENPQLSRYLFENTAENVQYRIERDKL